MGSSPLGGQAPSHSHVGPLQVESHRLHFSKLLLASGIFFTLFFKKTALFVEVWFIIYSFLFLTSIILIYTLSLISMTWQPFHMQHIWMPRFVTWQYQYNQLHRERIGLCLQHLMPQPHLAHVMLQWSQHQIIQQWLVQCCGGTYISHSSVSHWWSHDHGCLIYTHSAIKVYQQNKNISVITDNTNWFILKWHSSSKLCDYHICLHMRGTEIPAINLQVMSNLDSNIM